MHLVAIPETAIYPFAKGLHKKSARIFCGISFFENDRRIAPNDEKPDHYFS
jgi:hypothetical protein